MRDNSPAQCFNIGENQVDGGQSRKGRLREQAPFRPSLRELRQEKLGCSEGESPSRLMEKSVFKTKEMNGKV